MGCFTINKNFWRKKATLLSSYYDSLSSSNKLSNLLEPFSRKLVNGLQVNGGGGVWVFDREFTKSLMIRDFDDVLKNPFRYVVLF